MEPTSNRNGEKVTVFISPEGGTFSEYIIKINLTCRRLHELHDKMHDIYMRIRFSFFHSQYKEISLSYNFNSNRQYSKSTKLQWTCHLQTQYANDIIADIKLSLIPCYFCLCLFLLLCLLCLLLLILFLLISRRALLLLADLESPGL